ncbi:MAG: ROK family protein [Ruminococcaceae bacterium]|nr:ROK family protein [Oscillospiraceae bacterium]
MYYLGIDLGGMSIKAGVCDDNGKILYKDTCVTVRNEDGDRIINDMAALCLNVIKNAGLTVNDIEYAGIASPGSADSDKGTIIYASTLPFLNYPICEKLSERTGIKKVYVENDANAAAKGEATYGAAKGYKNSLFITIGTGVGGGIIIDGKIYTGFNFSGAELGHMVIVKDGESCSCGRRGCMECYASATGLIKLTKEKMLLNKDSIMWNLCDGNIDNVNGKTAFDAQRANDACGIAVVKEFIEYLACGIVNFINIFQPEVLSIGGGICKEGETLLAPIREIVAREQYSRHSDKQTIIKTAELGNDAGIIGAASLGK